LTDLHLNASVNVNIKAQKINHLLGKTLSVASKKTTLHDVAKASAVSHQTVSRVINKHSSVSSKTRERVLAAIERLGYQPNVTARQLVTGKSNTIGVISYGVRQYGPAQMLYSIEQALKGHGFGLILASLTELSLSDLETAISYVKQQGIEGIVIIIPLEIDISKVEAMCKATPFVLVDHPLQTAHSVAIDQLHGAQLATEHLLSLGHTNITTITGPLHWYDAKLRQEGFLTSLSKAKLEPIYSVESDWSAKGGFSAMQNILKENPAFSAVFAANDQMALGAMHALYEAGFSIPKDVSMIGFDDIPEASYFYPPLSTVRQDFTKLGNHSVSALIHLIQDTPLPRQTFLSPSLVVRQSTASRQP